MSDPLLPAESLSAWRARVRREKNTTQCGYWVLNADANYRWRGIDWVNDPQHEQVIDPVSGMTPYVGGLYGAGKGFGYFKGRPPPRFRVAYTEASKLGQATYFAGPSWIICSRSLAEFLREWQPDRIDILPIEVELKGGHIVPAGEYAFVDATLRAPAIDAEAMNLTVVTIDGLPGSRLYQPDIRRPYILRKDIPATARIFRDHVERYSIFVSDVVFKAYRKQRLSRRLYWRDPSTTTF